MAGDPIAPLAAQLLRLKDAKALMAFRRCLDKETAQKVIDHPSVSELDRAAIRLTLAFRNQGEQRPWNARRCEWDAAIVSDEATGDA